MGCGASQPYKAPTAADEDDQDDPKLREYLKMRGLDPVDMQNQFQQKVKMSPAEARRQGQGAGFTPDAVGEARSGFSNESKGGWQPKLPGQMDSDEEEEEEQERSSSRKKKSKGGGGCGGGSRSKGGSGSRSKGGSSSRSKGGSSSRDKMKAKGAAVLDKEAESGGKSRKKGSSSSSGKRSRSSSGGGGGGGSSRSKSGSGGGKKSSTKSRSKSGSKKRSEDKVPGAARPSGGGGGGGGGGGDAGFDGDEDDARLANYMKISMGRRNALPPPPGDTMALLAQYK